MAVNEPAYPAFETLRDQLIAVGHRFDASGWVPASSGNFSARIDAQSVAITASGRHKGELRAGDILRCELGGKLLTEGKSSYETGLHLQVYRRDEAIGAVLHSHSVAATVLSRHCGKELVLRDYELQKLFAGNADPSQALRLPVFPNEQDINLLAEQIDAHMVEHGTGHAYLIKGHGLYSWGADIRQAALRIEALEFMLECELTQGNR